MFIIYILKSKPTEKYYIGYTSNVLERLNRHNSNREKATKNKGPWELVYTESYATRSEALKREKYIKSQKSKKFIENLIVGKI